MINNTSSENTNRIIADNYDSTQKYDTRFGYFKMGIISNKMVKLANITSKDNILEIGGGTGELTVKYAKIANNIVVTDINQYMVKIIQQKANDNQNENMNFALTDAKKIPFKDNSFNIVLERNLPLIYENKFISDGTYLKVLKEMKRVSNDRIVVIHGNNSPLHLKKKGSHLFDENELKEIMEYDLNLFNVKIINATFSIPRMYYFLGESLSRTVEKICENNLLLKKFSGCLIACGSKTE